MKIVGLYKTREAASKARSLLGERGIADDRISLLAPDRDDGVRLATYSGHRVASTAWIGGAIGSVLGAFVFGLLATGNVTVPTVWVIVSGHAVGALFGAIVGFVPAAAIGALVGTRRRQLKADFFEADARRGAAALGVQAEDAAELEAVRYAFRATGALEVQGRLGRGLSAAAPEEISTQLSPAKE